jgi:hypothetical protein
VFRALDPLRWRLNCSSGILSQRYRAQERGAEAYEASKGLFDSSQDASRERGTYA